MLGEDTAILEFETTMLSAIFVNGVDIIRCNDEGRIIEFRVMIRPLQAVNLVHEQMAGDARIDDIAVTLDADPAFGKTFGTFGSGSGTPGRRRRGKQSAHQR